jgi:L-ribulokinase
LDFGTGSARALVVDTATGQSLGEQVVGYPRGARDAASHGGLSLPPRWVIQQPDDFLQAARALLRWLGTFAAGRDLRIAAIAVSATSCTVLPCLADGTPMTALAEFADEKHAWVKLWKHHAAARYADRVTESGAPFLQRYDGRTSAEWSLAKAMETMDGAPGLWRTTERWIDVADWIGWNLCGAEVRSASIAGCKNRWQPDRGGFPDAEDLESIGPGVSSWLDKLTEPRPLGTVAGPLAGEWRREFGGSAEAPSVGVGVVDAQAAVLGADVTEPGTLVVVAGTSTCHLSLAKRAVAVPGIESVVLGGAVNGLFDYVTGQPATGDMLAWFVGLVGRGGGAGAESVFSSLNRSLLESDGPSPVSVLDWWSGNRTPLARTDLSGVISGLSTTSTAEQIYRGMVEASAMGLRRALELHRTVGPITRIRITGGLSAHPAIMQIYANVLGEQVEVHPCQHGSARGAALWAAAGVGHEVSQPPRVTAYDPVGSEAYVERYAEYRAHGDAAAG